MLSIRKNRKNIAEKTMISLLVISLYLSIAGCSLSLADNRIPAGRIAFLKSPEITAHNGLDLVLADGEGNNLRYIGFFTGSPAFSPKGNLLAIGCKPSHPDSEGTTEICIVDIEKFLSTRDQIPFDLYYDTNTVITSKVALPEQCLGFRYLQDQPLEGILSLDWSPAGDAILVVCGNLKTREVCILPINGKSDCWDDAASTNVMRAVWSPIDENSIAISGLGYPTSMISIVDRNGSNIRSINVGMNPEWSPDGKKIAYVELITDSTSDSNGYGVAAINIDGSSHVWLYKPDPEKPESFINLYSWDGGWPSRLAWSPDGKYIVFSAQRGDMYNMSLFRLNITTGEITYFVDSPLFKNPIVEPDWGR
jgi:WD40 repeat protein